MRYSNWHSFYLSMCSVCFFFRLFLSVLNFHSLCVTFSISVDSIYFVVVKWYRSLSCCQPTNISVCIWSPLDDWFLIFVVSLSTDLPFPSGLFFFASTFHYHWSSFWKKRKTSKWWYWMQIMSEWLNFIRKKENRWLYIF